MLTPETGEHVRPLRAAMRRGPWSPGNRCARRREPARLGLRGPFITQQVPVGVADSNAAGGEAQAAGPVPNGSCGLPSRMRCIWLIPHGEAALRCLWKQLPGDDCIIREVIATGKYHRTSQAPSQPGAFSLNELRQRAFTHWAGVSGLEAASVGEEVIFEGFLAVKAVIEPAELELAA